MTESTASFLEAMERQNACVRGVRHQRLHIGSCTCDRRALAIRNLDQAAYKMVGFAAPDMHPCIRPKLSATVIATTLQL
jgi:hypothetical protein